MHTGMLWFDNSQSSFENKLQKAIDYYEKKYGRKPDMCMVNPSMLQLGNDAKKSVEVCKLTVRPYRPVLPGHIWIGIEDK